MENTAAKMSHNDSSHQALADRSMIEAVRNAYAYIEFDPDGTILDANQAFLDAMGYSIGEIRGKKHRMFVDEAYANNIEYRRFWEDLNAGHTQTREFKRVTKSGKPLWIKASYIPIKDESGRVVKVVKLAQDCTDERLAQVDLEGKINAIGKSEAVIEFNMDGTIISANDNFLNAMGYSLAEVKGQHHSMFVEPSQRSSAEYRQFWEKLNRGEFQAAEYKRVAKGGKEVWIQASYNPIFDINGKPVKVVKFATVVTDAKLKNADYEGQLDAISKSQAVIEFNLDGTILNANDNFLATLGYSRNEIIGKHHRMFVDEAFAKSSDYREFWDRLGRGEFDARKYKRIGKGGREVWIQASYNPIRDLNGKPFKVVKYATDITADVNKMNIIGDLAKAAETLGQASMALTASATQMTSNSAKTTAEAATVATVSDEVARGVRTVSTNTEEMAASIKEIARNAKDASSASSDTMRHAEATNITITKLGESSIEIGNVVKVISSIAQQTNLLALNATIEAARAGDAGRGFAVVANEVKELAKQTAKATEDITNKIGAIQKDTTSAVTAIGNITDSIKKLSSFANSIAASVEEQQATTNEVARVVQESSKGVMGIAESIKAVSSASKETQNGASSVLGSAKSLAELSDNLQLLVRRVQS